MKFVTKKTEAQLLNQRIKSPLNFRVSIEADIESIILISSSNDRFKMSEYTNEIDREELVFWIHDERSMVIVCEIENQVIGYAIGFLISPKWFYFDSIILKEEFRLLGIGREMYKFIRDTCSFNGVQLIHGLVKDDENSTLKYWKEKGFEKGEKFIWVEDWLD